MTPGGEEPADPENAPPAQGAASPEPVAEQTSPTEPVTWPELPPPPPGGQGPWWAEPGPPPPTAWAAGLPATATAPPARRGRAWIAALIAALVLLSGGIGIGWILTRGGTSTPSTGTEAPLKTVPPAGSSKGQSTRELSQQAIANVVDPAVVDVNTVIDGFNTGSFGRGAGTGMILTSSGQVLTNNHVIAGATSIRVTIQGRSGSYKAMVVGADPTDDVALLQIQGASGLPTVSLGDSSSLSLGQRVVAIGNALGKGGTPTVTSGSITALNRTITVRDESGSVEQLSNLIQSNAPISPGDSGGPLVNGSGQVVGIITAAARGAPLDRVSNVGFAIPINTAVGIANQIRSGHATSDIIIGQPGFLGVEVRNLRAGEAGQLGLNADSGALVVDVVSGMPAAKAGIRSPSVITSVAGHGVVSADALGPILYQYKPGQQVSVTWVDRNGTHTATVELAPGPAV
jgi:S1-C subfamily serine protease